jgi:hypothetical protein
MSDVIGVRISKKLKEDLQELKIDYAEEVRKCLESAVKRNKLKQAMKQVDRFRNELSKKVGVTTSSVDLIREDREHAH